MNPGAEKKPARFKKRRTYLRAEFVVETLKVNAAPTTHEDLDGVLATFMRDDFGKVKVFHAPHPHAHPTSPPSPPTFAPPPSPSRPSTHLTFHHTTPYFLKYSLHAAAQLKTELLRVAGKKACRRAILAMRPEIQECFTPRLSDINIYEEILESKPLAKPPTKPLAKPPAKKRRLKRKQQDSWIWKYQSFSERHCISADDFLSWDRGIMAIVGSGMGSGG